MPYERQHKTLESGNISETLEKLPAQAIQRLDSLTKSLEQSLETAVQRSHSRSNSSITSSKSRGTRKDALSDGVAGRGRKSETFATIGTEPATGRDEASRSKRSTEGASFTGGMSGTRSGGSAESSEDTDASCPGDIEDIFLGRNVETKRLPSKKQLNSHQSRRYTPKSGQSQEYRERSNTNSSSLVGEPPSLLPSSLPTSLLSSSTPLSTDLSDKSSKSSNLAKSKSTSSAFRRQTSKSTANSLSTSSSTAPSNRSRISYHYEIPLNTAPKQAPTCAAEVTPTNDKMRTAVTSVSSNVSNNGSYSSGFSSTRNLKSKPKSSFGARTFSLKAQNSGKSGPTEAISIRPLQKLYKQRADSSKQGDDQDSFKKGLGHPDGFLKQQSGHASSVDSSCTNISSNMNTPVQKKSQTSASSTPRSYREERRRQRAASGRVSALHSALANDMPSLFDEHIQTSRSPGQLTAEKLHENSLRAVASDRNHHHLSQERLAPGAG
ncbi:unnamed protein product [Anisakis simplex]|uniref:HECT-type E3 ubiquitin transferase n=1 Tax=Anisakis simplex TaxID=6269 RepID=A0A0M3J3F3_ANISI|nr:unnamed protein product [Anisakis simplex]